mmetsp:Transcript_36021/g.58110  ORF Transcript_36021/g.58110 Transcript_36021/m.58110 type:complete len:554 (-) Transcript_36021:245-1906(-)
MSVSSQSPRSRAAGGGSPAMASNETGRISAEQKKLDGDFKSLRTQFREFQKKYSVVDLAEANKLRSEFVEMKDLMKQHGGAQQAMNQLTQQVQQQAEGLNRQAREMQKLEQQNQEMQRQAQQKLEQQNREMQKLEQKTEQVQQQASVMTALKREMDVLKRELQDAKNLKKDLADHKQQQTRDKAELRREMPKMIEKELGKIGSELKSADLGTMKMVVSNTSQQFKQLQKQIYDSGVLRPKIEIVEEAEAVPVGMLELGEDMFSARLLVKLGFIKGRQEACDEARELFLKENPEMNNSDMEEDSEEPEHLRFDELVHGIMIPEVREGGNGYFQVTYGWLMVCAMCMAVQLLIVLVVIRHGIHAGEICLDEPRSGSSWWTLHVSKACAVVVAGTLMGKELMDTVNYLMVSILLEGNNDIEVVASAIIRIITIILIALANIVSFATAYSPADVFMSMTALSFIGEIGNFGLDIAKRGVLGHHIGKVMTELNFQIHLMTEYPPWFRTVHNITLTLTGGFTIFFTFLLMFQLNEPICGADGTGTNIFSFLTDFFSITA